MSDVMLQASAMDLNSMDYQGGAYGGHDTDGAGDTVMKKTKEGIGIQQFNNANVEELLGEQQPESEGCSLGSESMDTEESEVSAERNTVIVQMGNSPRVKLNSYTTIIVNIPSLDKGSKNNEENEERRNDQGSPRNIKVIIQPVIQIVSASSEATSAGLQSVRIGDLQAHVSIPEEPLVEEAMYTEMQQAGCFASINAVFGNLLRRIRRGSIILDLSPASPESLHYILQVIRSGELNSLVLEVLQKKKVLDLIQGTTLKIEIEIHVPEDIFKASGLSLEDIKCLSESLTPQADGSHGHLVSGIIAKGWSRSIGQITPNVEIGLFHKGDKICNLVIIGKTGSGKSGLANAILGQKVFLSTLSGSPVTRNCQTESTVRDSYVLKVTDTPGAGGREADNQSLITEKLQNLLKSLTGTTFFLLTCRIGRWKEDELAMMFYKQILGIHLMNNLIIVFTGKDDLDKHSTTLEEYLKTSTSLQQLVSDADNRVVAFSKRDTQNEKEEVVKQLMTTVMKMAEDSSRQNYTWDMMEEAAEVKKGRQMLSSEKEQVKKLKEKEAIEEHVRQNIQQLDTQGRKLEELETEMRQLLEVDALQRMGGQADGSSVAGNRAQGKYV